MTLLAYGFAKRHGVILLDAGEVAVVGLREGADPLVLVEARRALGLPLKVEPLSSASPSTASSPRFTPARPPGGRRAATNWTMPSGGLDQLSRRFQPPPTCWTARTTPRSSA